MIELRHATKRYGKITAVEDISFTAPEGQIIGLLGQNGAGKTTTLNMLTGYFPPTSGSVWINGMDMLFNARECKRHIGYLPEQPPLYDEMTVKEYLAFVSRLREVRRSEITGHIGNIMHLCGLQEVADRRLLNLSKGYRQRAGIAQALCGDPAVLVFDEPTVGLDPKQVVEIRSLIRKLGENHTVIFSSHILSEVQQLCSRVLVLHNGHLIRECSTASLTSGQDALVLQAVIAGHEETLLPALRTLPGIRRVRLLPSPGNGLVQVETEWAADTDQPPQVQLFHLLAGLNMPLMQLMPRSNSLEEVFLRITSSGNGKED